MLSKVKIGIIGCGNISQAYFNGAKLFDILEIKACADLSMANAEAKAKENNVKAMTVDEILQDPEIEIIVNLTTPGAHAAVNRRILEAGKHAYCEKPFAVEREEAKKVIELANKNKLLSGCAPDTFLGAGQQTCRKLIDDGWIGKPVAGTAFMMCHGHESWHPAPGFYYQKGGGPMMDMGPYYLTTLVNMLGPVKRVCASAQMTFTERTGGSGTGGKKFPVEVPTHYSGTLDFQNGAVINMAMSFDVWGHSHHPIEIYGTEGSMKVPDPNTFGGTVLIKRSDYQEWKEIPLSHNYSENSRGIGVADMAYAIKTGRKHRCSAELAYHVLDVMRSFEESSDNSRHLRISSSCEQPAALPLNLIKGQLDE